MKDWMRDAWCRLAHRAHWRLVYEHRNTYRQYKGYVCDRCSKRRLVAAFTAAMFTGEVRR